MKCILGWLLNNFEGFPLRSTPNDKQIIIIIIIVVIVYISNFKHLQLAFRFWDLKKHFSHVCPSLVLLVYLLKISMNIQYSRHKTRHGIIVRPKAKDKAASRCFTEVILLYGFYASLLWIWRLLQNLTLKRSLKISVAALNGLCSTSCDS